MEMGAGRVAVRVMLCLALAVGTMGTMGLSPPVPRWGDAVPVPHFGSPGVASISS